MKSIVLVKQGSEFRIDLSLADKHLLQYGLLRAGVLYTGVAVLATITGAAIAETLVFSINGNRMLLIATGILFAACCWIVYKFLPRLESWLGLAEEQPSE